MVRRQTPDMGCNGCQHFGGLLDVGSAAREAGAPADRAGSNKENQQICSDGERLAFLESKLTAPEGFQWPYSERLDKGQIRRKVPRAKAPQRTILLLQLFAF